MFFFTGNGSFQSAIVVFRNFASYRFRQCSFYGIALVACYFGAHITANSSRQILANGIGHVICRRVGNVLGAVAQGFRSNVSNVLGIVGNTSILSCISDIFRSRIFDIFSSVGNSTVISCIGNISIGRCIGNVICCFIGNRIRCFIDQFLSFINDSATSCGIGNIRRSLGGRSRVGSIGDFAGDVIYLLIYFGEYRIRRINLIEDFIDSLLKGRGLAIGIIGDHIAGFRCIHLLYISINSIGSRFGLTFFRQSRGAGISFSIRSIHFAVDRSHIPAMNFGIIVFIQFAGQGLGIEFAINRQILIHRQIPADGSIARGFQSTGLDIASLYRTGRLNRAVTSIKASGSNLTVGIYLEGAVGCAQGACRLQITVAVDGSITISCFYSTVAVNGKFAVRCCHSTVAVDCEFAIGCFHAAVGAQGNLAISCLHAAIAVDCEFAVRCFDRTIGCKGGLATGRCYAAVAIYFEVTIGYTQGSNSIDVAIIADGHVAITNVKAVGFHNAGSAIQFDLVVDIDRAIRAVDREFAVCAFDGAVRLQRSLGFAVGIAAGVDAVFIYDRAVGANLDSIFVQGNLIVITLVQDHFIGIGLGSGHVALGVNGSSVLLQYIVIAQAQAAVDGFHQFGICCHTGRSFCRNLIIQCRIGCCPFLGFLGISLVQSREPISHVLVDGIEPIHHILVDLLDDLILGCIGTNSGSRFFC